MCVVYFVHCVKAGNNVTLTFFILLFVPQWQSESLLDLTNDHGQEVSYHRSCDEHTKTSIQKFLLNASFIREYYGVWVAFGAWVIMMLLWLIVIFCKCPVAYQISLWICYTWIKLLAHKFVPELGG